jgi:hypothetical protein
VVGTHHELIVFCLVASPPDKIPHLIYHTQPLRHGSLGPEQRLAPKIRTLPRRHLILTTPCKLDDCLVYGNHQPRRDHGCSSSSSTTRLLVLPPLLELGDDNHVPVRSSTSQGSTQAPGRWTA